MNGRVSAARGRGIRTGDTDDSEGLMTPLRRLLAAALVGCLALFAGACDAGEGEGGLIEGGVEGELEGGEGEGEGDE